MSIAEPIPEVLVTGRGSRIYADDQLANGKKSLTFMVAEDLMSR
ncbi:hypothetical protein [Arthrobacter glacialis]|nr:hypothetical protein [Arthrobacter glacialis]